MCALWVAKGSTFPHAENYDSDQNVLMRKIIFIIVVLTCQLALYAGSRFISKDETQRRKTRDIITIITSV